MVILWHKITYTVIHIDHHYSWDCKDVLVKSGLVCDYAAKWIHKGKQFKKDCRLTKSVSVFLSATERLLHQYKMKNGWELWSTWDESKSSSVCMSWVWLHRASTSIFDLVVLSLRGNIWMKLVTANANFKRMEQLERNYGNWIWRLEGAVRGDWWGIKM